MVNTETNLAPYVVLFFIYISRWDGAQRIIFVHPSVPCEAALSLTPIIFQASEEENRLLRKENQLLRQRTRTSRLSSSSFRGHNDAPEQTILPDEEDKIIAADVKRNSLMFVGDSIPSTGEHAALEAQYKKLQVLK